MGHDYCHEATPLVVEKLTTYFFTPAGIIRAVSEVGFTLEQGRCLALIGESGAGKSVTALSLLRMVPSPGRITAGRVILAGRDLLGLPAAAMRAVRGAEISIMFQDPLASFNPVRTVGAQIRETILAHRPTSRAEATEIALEKLEAVKLPARRAYRSYSFQLSGGMRQRAALALALALHPRVLVADEPTTFLDVTLQRQILAELQRQLADCCLSLLLITHDLAAAAAVADRVAILYAGTVVECGPLAEVFRHPLHPYTRSLIRSHPAFRRNGARLQPIPGSAPRAVSTANGCPFQPRCPHPAPACGRELPLLRETGENRLAACHVAPAANTLSAASLKAPGRRREEVRA